MATFTAIRNKKQSASVLRSVIEYVEQEKKTRWGDARLVTGHNCVPQSALTEMQMTKNRFRKPGGMQFYHFVQSFSADDNVTPQEVNAIGLEFAQRQFPDFEVVVATHVDTGHLHNHFVVNSVSCADGHKLHQSYSDLLTHRKVNDEICLAHGLNVLEQPEQQRKKKRMKPGEYRAGLRRDSWKLDLIQAINEALEYSITPEDFIENMEVEGYEVTWVPNRKHITFTCPNGRKCRDSSLHDETFLKENLEALFVYRQATDFRPQTPEPDEGWLGELAYGWLRVMADLERDANQPLLTPPIWTDSKQRRREALKKLAMGQKFGGEEHHFEQTL
ncbi:MAG: relaxase/mobilization nuclease domain-containing protein [Clostridiales bacterium]|nr:relaxase/mobilization nuclease domain-containing protein [Clostridiales bacterium]